MSDENLIYDTFTMDCPDCGPGTIKYERGRKQPHSCDYEPPALVIEYDGEITADELQAKATQSLDDIAVLDQHPDGAA